MFVWTDKIDVNALSRAIKNGVDLRTFSDNLVPKFARHISGIMSNQRYVVALKIRKLGLDFKTRKALIQQLCNDVSITGLLNQVVSLQEVLDSCDTDTLLKAFENE